MKYLALDIETTGLRRDNPEDMDTILSVGMVVDDLENPLPIKDLPHSHILIDVADQDVTGNLVALTMNNELMLSIIEEHRKVKKKLIGYDISYAPYKHYYFTKGMFVPALMADFITCHIKDPSHSAITVAGKNVMDFDVQFLNNKFHLSKSIKIANRSIDPSIFFMEPSDKFVPSLSEAKKRAGLNEIVQHDALADAIDIVKLIRIGMKINTAEELEGAEYDLCD